MRRYAFFWGFLGFLFLTVASVTVIFFWARSECPLGEIKFNKTLMTTKDELRYMVSIPKTNLLVTATFEGECTFWDQTFEKPIKAFEVGQGVIGICASADGKMLVVGTVSTTLIEIISWKKSELGKCGIGHRFIGTTPRIAMIDRDNDILIFDPREPTRFELFKQTNKSVVFDLATAKHRPLIGLGFFDGTIQVWNIEKGEKILDVRETGKRIKRLLFVCDDRQVIAGDSDGYLALWDLESREKKGELRAHDGSITSLDSDPAGNYCFSVAADKSLHATSIYPFGKCRSLIATPTRALFLAFSSNKQELFYGNLSGSVWRISFATEKNDR